MIRLRARIRRRALDGIEPILLGTVAFDSATGGKRARVSEPAIARTHEVGVERQDDVGLLDKITRVDVLAEGKAATLARVVTAERLPLHPLGARESLQKVIELSAERRRGHGFCEDADASPLRGLLRAQHLAHRGGERIERPNLPEMGDRLRSIWIVQTENRRLREQIRCTEARRMVGIAFDLRRPSFVALDEETNP
jgi:hypothetical protein